jgi:hypothetical protein
MIIYKGGISGGIERVDISKGAKTGAEGKKIFSDINCTLPQLGTMSYDGIPIPEGGHPLNHRHYPKPEKEDKRK